MNGRYRIRLEVISLLCALILVVMSAMPLYNEKTDAQLLTLITASLSAGVLLSNLLRNLKRPH